MKSFSRDPAVTVTDKLVVLAKVLVQTQILECNQFAFGMLWRNKDARRLIRLKDIEQLGHNIDNWVTVDTRSILIAGWAWRENQISDQDVLNRLSSENRWWRRTAVVSTVPLNLRSRGDVPRTLTI